MRVSDRTYREQPVASAIGEAKKVAVLRALYLGDILLLIPALRAVRKALPNAEITMISLPWAKTFLRRFNYTDRFLEFPGFPGIPEAPFDDRRSERFLRRARSYSYDLALQLHGNGAVTNFFVAALGAAMSIGFYRSGDEASPLTAGIEYQEKEHEICRPLRLLGELGIRPAGEHLEFPLLASDWRSLRIISDVAKIDWGRPVIGIAPSAKAPARRWPAKYFASVADNLASVYGAQILICASLSDKSICDQVEKLMVAPAVNLAGMTSLGVLGAMISRMSLFLSNDSGPAHIATAVGTPSVTIFGPTDPGRWGPLDQSIHKVVCAQVPCSPCDFGACPAGHGCMSSVQPSVVYEQTRQLMKEAGAV